MGESIEDLENRVIPKFLGIIKENQNNEKIFMVLHNWVIKVILSHIIKYNM
jgi:broad specificity phosphatase PhoE